MHEDALLVIADFRIQKCQLTKAFLHSNIINVGVIASMHRHQRSQKFVVICLKFCKCRIGRQLGEPCLLQCQQTNACYMRNRDSKTTYCSVDSVRAVAFRSIEKNKTRAWRICHPADSANYFFNIFRQRILVLVYHCWCAKETAVSD